MSEAKIIQLWTLPASPSFEYEAAHLSQQSVRGVAPAEPDDTPRPRAGMAAFLGRAGANAWARRNSAPRSRVRSEEPPGRSLMTQFKHGLRHLGSNMRLSFRNLVRLSPYSSSASSRSSVEFFRPCALGRRDTSTLSLNVRLLSNPAQEAQEAEPAPDRSPDPTTPTPRVQLAPKAELDTFSTDSFPFDASRYDNLEEARLRSPLSL